MIALWWLTASGAFVETETLFVRKRIYREASCPRASRERRPKAPGDGMVQDELSLTLNGHAVTCRVSEGLSLLDLLREELGLNGPKYGCGLAQCGACTVLIDGTPARACVLRAEKVAAHEVTTLEGLADPQTGALHPLQQAFLSREGAQCGYCLNGMVMSARALLDRNPDPSEDEIRAALRHNLCRCGAHLEIVASVREAARLMREAGGAA